MYVLWALGLYCVYFFQKQKVLPTTGANIFVLRVGSKIGVKEEKNVQLQRTHSCTRFSCTQRGGGQLQRALPPSWGTAAIIERLQFSCSHDLLLRSIQGRPLETVSLRLGFAEIYLQKNALGFNKGGCKR